MRFADTILALGFVAGTLPGCSPTYIAEFTGKTNISVEITELKSDGRNLGYSDPGEVVLKGLKSDNFIGMEMRYLITANRRFAHIRAQFMEDGLPSPFSLQALIDKRKMVLYDLDEKTYCKNMEQFQISDSLKKVNDTLYKATIIDPQRRDTAFITFNSNLPGTVCIQHVIKGSPYGMQSYHSQREKLTLQSVERVRNRLLRLYRKTKQACRKETHRCSNYGLFR